jgi:CRP-like cAMP-binding protein
VLADPDEPANALFMVLQGVLLVQTPHEEYERGPGAIVGYVEKLDGSEDVRVVAKTDARLVIVDRAAYEAALSG